MGGDGVAAECDFHGGEATGREENRVGADVAGFHAEHVQVFLVPDVRQAQGFGDPWIPNDGGCRAGFGDADDALEAGIGDLHGGGRVVVNALDLAGDLQGSGAFREMAV